MFVRDRFGHLDPQDLRQQFETNTLAPLLLSQAIAPRFVNGSKVALISSHLASMTLNDSGAHYGYRLSKTALTACGVNLAQDLRPRGVSVLIVHPGRVQTDMTGHRGDLTAQLAARAILEQIDTLTLEESGRFLTAQGKPMPW